MARLWCQRPGATSRAHADHASTPPRWPRDSRQEQEMQIYRSHHEGVEDNVVTCRQESSYVLGVSPFYQFLYTPYSAMDEKNVLSYAAPRVGQSPPREF